LYLIFKSYVSYGKLERILIHICDELFGPLKVKEVVDAMYVLAQLKLTRQS